MLISNYYYTYKTDDTYIWGGANINSSSNYDTIFEVEMININKGLSEWLKAYTNNEDRINSDTKQRFDIYVNDENLSNDDAYRGFGFITLKEA